MRICIDATSLLLRSAGVKNYVYHWILSMQRECRQHTVHRVPHAGQGGVI